MLNHLDDPTPHEYPEGFRARVGDRARALTRRRQLATAAASVVVAVVIGSLGLYGRAATSIDDVERLEVAGTGEPAPAHPRSLLVVGVDESVAGGPVRNDTILIVELDDDGASVLSVPRDLAVADPEGTELVRINSISARYGYSALLEVIDTELGIDVDNLVEVDFDGFTTLVDLVGGIDVATTTAVRDELSGLSIESAGCHRLDGHQALALARSRRLEFAEDGQWRTDPTSDLGRIARQPALLAAGLEALGRVRPDPLTADRLAGWLADHAAVDDSLGNRELVGLVGTLMELEPGQLRFTTVPVEPVTLPNGAAVLQQTGDLGGTVDVPGDTAELASGAVVRPCGSVADGSAIVGQPAPALRGESLLGGEVDLAALRGQPVVVSFTATWCVPCLRDLHDLVELAGRRPDVAIVSVAFDDRTDSIVRAFEEAGADWALLSDPDGSAAARFGITGVPVHFVIGPDGEVQAALHGEITAEQLLDELG